MVDSIKFLLFECSSYFAVVILNPTWCSLREMLIWGLCKFCFASVFSHFYPSNFYIYLCIKLPFYSSELHPVGENGVAVWGHLDLSLMACFKKGQVQSDHFLIDQQPPKSSQSASRFLQVGKLAKNTHGFQKLLSQSSVLWWLMSRPWVDIFAITAAE